MVGQAATGFVVSCALSTVARAFLLNFLLILGVRSLEGPATTAKPPRFPTPSNASTLLRTHCISRLYSSSSLSTLSHQLPCSAPTPQTTPQTTSILARSITRIPFLRTRPWRPSRSKTCSYGYGRNPERPCCAWTEKRRVSIRPRLAPPAKLTATARKPVDPPPIVQVVIKNRSDPMQ